MHWLAVCLSDHPEPIEEHAKPAAPISPWPAETQAERPAPAPCNPAAQVFKVRPVAAVGSC